MNVKDFGINNITEIQLNFNYDKFYKEIGLKYKNAKKSDINLINDEKMNKLNELLNNVYIDTNSLKYNFINVIKREELSLIVF